MSLLHPSLHMQSRMLHFNWSLQFYKKRPYVFYLSCSSLFLLSSPSLLVLMYFWWTQCNFPDIAILKASQHEWSIPILKHSTIVLLKISGHCAIQSCRNLFQHTLHSPLSSKSPSAKVVYTPLQCDCWLSGLYFPKQFCFLFLSWISCILILLSLKLMFLTIYFKNQQDTFCELYGFMVWFNSIFTLLSLNHAQPTGPIDCMIINMRAAPKLMPPTSLHLRQILVVW